MNWREYCKSVGMTDEQIKGLEAMPQDLLVKTFEEPIRLLAEATAARDTAVREKTEFEDFYNQTVLPKVTTVYQDAINARTRQAAVEARLRAATDYGFLSADMNEVPGSPGGTPVTTRGGTGTGTGVVPPPTVTFDTTGFVKTEDFNKVAEGMPDMLMRLLNISNEHQRLFGVPLSEEEGTAMLEKAKASKGRMNIRQVWEQDFKVGEKRAAIATSKQVEHDRQVAEEAVRKYTSEHGHPFIKPGTPSLASKFATQAKQADSRHPWKGAAERKQERRQLGVQAFVTGGGQA
jgi:hypothetical protein